MRVWLVLLALAALAAGAQAHSSGSSCQTSNDVAASDCHDAWEFEPTISLSVRYFCGDTNQLIIPVSFGGGGYGHQVARGRYVNSVVVEAGIAGIWQSVAAPSDTYSRTYFHNVETHGTYQARITITTQEGTTSATSGTAIHRSCTAGDYAPSNMQSSTIDWTTCGHMTRFDSSWDYPAKGRQVSGTPFRHFEVIPFDGPLPGAPVNVAPSFHRSTSYLSPAAGTSADFHVQVTAVMNSGERGLPANGPVVTRRLCTPFDIDFKAQVTLSNIQPCGGPFRNTISYTAPPWVTVPAKTAWQSWSVERRIQGSEAAWLPVHTGTTRNSGSYTDDSVSSNGPLLGITYDYRVVYNGREGAFASSTVSSKLEDCPTAAMRAVVMMPVCPPRNEVEWRLEPRMQDTKQPPSGLSIQRSDNGGSWQALNEYSNGGIAHQAVKDSGFDHEWWNYNVWGGHTYSYRIQYFFGAKGSTTSAPMAANAAIVKCGAPEILEFVGHDASGRGQGGEEGRIEFKVRWDFLDSATPEETRRTWLNDRVAYYRVDRCDSHPPGQQLDLEPYRINGHDPMVCPYRGLVRNDLVADVAVNLNHVRDDEVWGNISYEYQGIIDTRTDDYLSNTAATWIRGEPWPVGRLRIETFPYLHLDPDASNPPGDYPPELATEPKADRFGFAEVSFTPGNDGAGGPALEYEFTFRFKGQADESAICRFTPDEYDALRQVNQNVTWRARGPLDGLVYPKDFSQSACTGPVHPLVEGSKGHVVLVRTRNALGWGNVLQVDGVKAWNLDLGEEDNDHSNPDAAGSANPTTRRTKTLERTDRITHDVFELANQPAPLRPPGYTAPRYPGTTFSERLLREAEPLSSFEAAGQPCQGPVLHQVYVNEQRGQELYGAKGKRLYGFDDSYAKVRLWFYASQLDFNTTDNPVAWDAKAPLRYYEFLGNETWLNHTHGRFAFVNQDTQRDEEWGHSTQDEDEQWGTKDREAYANWEAFFQDDNGIPGDPPHFDFPDVDAFRLPFNGIGSFCFVDQLTADGEVTESSRSCSFFKWDCDTKDTDWQPGNPHFLGTRIDVGDTATTFTHLVYGEPFQERSEYHSSATDQKPRVPHNPPAADACKCYRQTLNRTEQEHRLTQRFTSTYNLYEELQSRGNGRPAAGTEAMFFDEEGREEDPPVDAQFMQQYDGVLPEAIKDEIARRNLEGAEAVRPPNATAGEPETPAEARYYSNGTEHESGHVVHPYLGHLWAEVVPDRSVWWNGSYVVDGSFRPVLWVGAMASPMVEWMEANNITMDPPHVRWTYLLEVNESSPEYGLVGPRMAQPLVEGGGWNYTAPELNLTREFLADSTARLTLFVDFGWRTRDGDNQTLHTLNLTTTMLALVHVPTLANSTLAEYGLPVLKHDENPRGQDVVRAFWHSYPDQRAPWVGYDRDERRYEGTPEALYFRTDFADHYEYRDPDPTPTGAWGTAELAVNSTDPSQPAHPDDQARLEATDEFLHVATMPRNRDHDDGDLHLSWTLFDAGRVGTATSPSPEDARFNVVRNADADRILSYGWLNDQAYAGQPPGSLVPIDADMRLEYLIRITPTLNWDGGDSKTRLDSSECRHGRWSLEVRYSDGSTATAGSISHERCMADDWRREVIPLQRGLGLQSIRLVGRPYVSMSFQCDDWSCGNEPDSTGRNSVYNVYLDGMRIRKQVGPDVSYLHLWDHYQPSLPLFESTGFEVDQFFLETARTPLSPRNAAERYEMVAPGDPFLVFEKVPDLVPAGTSAFLHPHLVQGIIIGELDSARAARGPLEDDLSRMVQERELEVARSLGWSDPAYLPYAWYQDASDTGLEHHINGPWLPSATDAYLRYWSHLRGDADKDESATWVPDEDANAERPGRSTLNERFLPSFTSSFATHIVHATDEHPDGPDFLLDGWSPDDMEALRDYYLRFQNPTDAAFLRNFEGTYTYLTTIPEDDLPRQGLAAGPLWPFHDAQPSNFTLGQGYNLTVGELVPAGDTWTPEEIERAVADVVLDRGKAQVSPGNGTAGNATVPSAVMPSNATHVEVYPLPVHLDACWRFLTADNGTAIDPASPDTNASLLAWKSVDLLHNVTSNITKSLQVRIYATVHRGGIDEARISRDICQAPNNHTVPMSGPLRLMLLYREADEAPGGPVAVEGLDKIRVGSVDLLAPYNATSSYVELTFNATGVPTFYAIYDSWETYLKGDTLLIGQFDGPEAPTTRLNWGSMLVAAILAAVMPYLIHRAYTSARKGLGS